MWLVKNKNGKVLHEVKPSRFMTAVHKAAQIKEGTVEAGNGCVLPMSAEDLLKEIQEKRDSYKVNRQASHNVGLKELLQTWIRLRSTCNLEECGLKKHERHDASTV